MKNLFSCSLIIFIVPILFYTSILNASDNIIYKKSNGDLGLLNGATLTTKLSSLSNYSIMSDLNNKPMIKRGDFNGDGKDEIVFAEQTESYYMTIYTVDISNNFSIISRFVIYDAQDRAKLHSHSMPTTLKNYPFPEIKSPLFLESGDFNADKKDDILLVYADTDAVHETAITYTLDATNSWTKLSGPYPITNKYSYGNLSFTRTGKFKGGDTTDAVFIYENVDTDHETALTYKCCGGSSADNGFECIGGPYHLTNTSMGRIAFVNIGYFNADALEDLNFIYVKSSDPYKYWSLTYNPINIPGTTNFNGLSNPYQLTNSGMGKVVFSDAADLNGDGQDDLLYIYRNDTNLDDWVLAYTPTNNFAEIAYAFRLTGVGGNDKIKTLNVGDFDGDGRQEFTILHKTDSATFDSVAVYCVTNHTFSKIISNPSVNTLQEGNTAIAADFTLTIGPVTKYMSKSLNKYFHAIKNSTFYFGWWGSLGIFHDYPNYGGDYPTAFGDSLFKNDVGNFASIGTSANWEIGHSSQLGEAVDRLNTTTSSTTCNCTLNSSCAPIYKKNVLVQGFWAGMHMPIDSDGRLNSDYNSSIDNIYKLKTNILGYYIADDIHDAITGQRSYLNNPPLTSTQYLTLRDSLANKGLLTFAGETYEGLKWAYDSLSTNFCDVPVLYEYPFYASSSPGSIGTAYLIINMTQKLEDLYRLTLLNNSKGYLYCSQAYRDGAEGVGEDRERRAATQKELRYDVFNAIIHHAAGVSFFQISQSDATVINRILNICRELRYTGSGALLNSLGDSTATAPEIWSSRDGYNKDFDVSSATHLGSSISDINYCFRQDGTAIYLLTINNSNAQVGQTKFYLPVNSGTITELLPSYLADYDSNNFIEYNKLVRGKYYNVLTVCNYDTFQVRIFQIGTPSSNRIVDIKEETINLDKYELYQNYPNPFNPTTNINYNLLNAIKVKICIYDVLGKLVKTLVNDFEVKGKHSIKWDGSNESGIKSSSGIYFYRLTAGEYADTKKLILLK
jgi:hypothetical protein